MSDKPCSVEGCELVSIARGLCWTHYSRLRKKGTTDSPTFPNKGKVCAAEGCDLAARAWGFCNMHYLRLKHHGDVTYTRPDRPPVICTVPNCGRFSFAKGLCQGHWSREYRHLDIAPDVPIRFRTSKYAGQVCGVDGCQGHIYARHRCKKHYAAWTREREKHEQPANG